MGSFPLSKRRWVPVAARCARHASIEFYGFALAAGRPESRDRLSAITTWKSVNVVEEQRKIVDRSSKWTLAFVQTIARPISREDRSPR